jgi:polyvinyl alcohol dehydrogenase (cytochrome)
MRPILTALFSLSSIFAAAPGGLDLYTKKCARCHELLPPLQTRALMKDMTPEYIFRALTTGAMRRIGEELSDEDRTTLAEFLSEKKLNPGLVSRGACAASEQAALTGPQWNGWGADLENSRFQKDAGLAPGQVSKLKLAWAFGFPGDFSSYAQPTVVGKRIYAGSTMGVVYALDARTGCTYWTFDARAGVRSAITIGPDNVAYFGDIHANVYALDALSGKQIWKTQVESYPSARVTGSPKLYQGNLYVPVSSRDEWFSADATFECCKFRGSVVAVDAKTGKQVWKTFTIAEAAKPLGKKKGTQRWGPSGAGVWNSPTIDAKKSVLYVGTGDSYSDPPTPMSDSILALSLNDGKIVWSRQLTQNDVFNGNCMEQNQSTCPEKPGPDADFAASPILHTMADGRRVLLAGQKSGILHALDPDRDGKVMWQTKLGKGGVFGGIQWGPAADGDTAYAAISDLGLIAAPEGVIPDPKMGGGLHAVQIATGEKLWSVMPAGPCEKHRCSPAQSAAITAIPGAVFSGSLDGHIRAYASKDGAILWDFDTAKDFETVNKVAAKGGSLDGPGPVVVDGMLLVNSGYAFFNGMPGNVLLAFTAQ